jgi:hypothetical protein
LPFISNGKSLWKGRAGELRRGNPVLTGIEAEGSTGMTTEKDKSQTEQDLSSPNQDPNRKAPAQHPADPPKKGDTGSPGAQNTINGPAS